ncbi:hypothetical protein N566_22435, partial [Streptomycetaceae bacterium MP113-05]
LAGPRFAGTGNADGMDTDASRAQTVARHYAWWVAHPSVSASRVGDEADAIVAAVQAAQRAGHAAAAVLLARSAAPVLAAVLRWGAWERMLRSGQEASRSAGEVAEQGYFHHELGVLALCQGNPERARTELDASIALRAALADRHGTVAGRRALALVTDRLAAMAAGDAPHGPASSGAPAVAGGASGAPAGLGRTAANPVIPATDAPRGGTSDSSTTSSTSRPVYGAKPTSQEEITAAALSTAAAMDDSIAALRSEGQEGYGGDPRLGGRRGTALRSTRKNVLAAGAGAVLAAVLGTVVTLGAASDSSDAPPDRTVQPGEPDSQPDDRTDDPGASGDGGTDEGSGPPDRPVTPGPSGEATPSPSPSANGGVPADPSSSSDEDSSSTGGSGNGGAGDNGGSGGGGDDGSSPTPEPSDEDSSPPATESPEPSESPDPSPSPTDTTGGDGETSSPPTVSGPAPSATASGTSPSGTASGGPVS